MATASDDVYPLSFPSPPPPDRQPPANVPPPVNAVEPLAAKYSKRLNALEALMQQWKGVGLTALQRSTLEADAMTLTSNRELVQQGRKTLLARTKEFMKLSLEQRAAELSALLKLYQQYVDEISRYFKQADASFFALHDAVKQMVDPVPVIERMCRDRAQLLDLAKAPDEISTLKRTIAEREAELLELGNQQLEIQRLREQLAEAQAQAAAASDAEQSASQAQTEVQAVMRQWQLQEAMLQSSILTLSQQCRKYQVVNTDLEHQVTTLRAQIEQGAHQNDEELERCIQDRQASVVEAAASAARVSKLERELEEVRSQLTASEKDRFASVDETPLKSSQQRVVELERALEDAKQSIVVQQQQHSAATAAISQEKAEVEARSQEEIRQANCRLEVCQAELFGLQAEAAALRARCGSAEERCAALVEKISEVEKENRVLSQKNVSKSFDLATIMVAESVAESSSPIEGQMKEGGDLVAALTAQRDRYKQRLHTLEEVTSSQISDLRAHERVLQQENFELARAVQMQNEGGAAPLEVGRDLISNADHDAHEKRRTGGLAISLIDQFALTSSRFVSATRWTRRLFILYVALVHLFVTILIMRSAAAQCNKG